MDNQPFLYRDNCTHKNKESYLKRLLNGMYRESKVTNLKRTALSSIRSFIKVAGDSMLIYAFAYSLFVGVYLVISNMTGYSHSCHWIKLTHCGAPQRDVLSDRMVL